MWILDLFFRDESAEWPEQRERDLTLDLREMSLCGIRLGAAATELSYFGRPSNRRAFQRGIFFYERTGIVIGTEEGRVAYFGLPLRKRATDKVGPCEARVVFPDGAEIGLNDTAAVDTLLPHLPDPVATDTDEDETIHFFSIRGRRLELEASLDGHVCRLNLFPEDAADRTLESS